MWVRHPRVVRRADDLLLDFGKASSLQHLPGVVLIGDGAIRPFRGVGEITVPLRERRAGGQGTIIATGFQVDFHLFEVSITWFEVPEQSATFSHSRNGWTYAK